MTDHALTLYGNRPRRLPNEEERRLLIQRVISWALVILIHAVLMAVLLLDQLHWRTALLAKPPAETMLDLTQLRPRGQAPPVVLIRPIVPRAAPPEISNAPVIVVPPPPNVQVVPPKTQAEILKAIGEALSCGAENFENLTQAERNRCKHEPWIARKLPNGTIVLEAAAPSPFAPAPAPTITGGEALRRELQTAPKGCSLVSNLPCMNVTPQISIPVN
ncbi:MAG TPA: hypothetical protein VN685_12470 [Rhizomicrobium sp.]|nr:hypothetical protein [Rhizomicrobium sp.]